MSTSQHHPDHILDFWFNEVTPEQWWIKSDAFDQWITQRFGSLLLAAERCELYAWRETAKGRLAEIIVLDQFSRNIYRDTPRAFANDPLALGLAQTAVALKADLALEPSEKAFLYMPYMHSESPMIHTLAVSLFSQKDMEASLNFEYQHKTIIDRFGRYPHRNDILDRPSTPEEIAFLATPGSSF